jgi:hypothetical protein
MESQGSKISSDLILYFKREKNIYAIIEIKHEIESLTELSEEDLVKKLIKLANLSLDTMETKDYGIPYEAHSDEIIKIGLGVYASGECLALIK